MICKTDDLKYVKPPAQLSEGMLRAIAGANNSRITGLEKSAEAVSSISTKSCYGWLFSYKLSIGQSRLTDAAPLQPRSQNRNFIEQIQCQRNACRIDLQITRKRQGKPRAAQ